MDCYGSCWGSLRVFNKPGVWGHSDTNLNDISQSTNLFYTCTTPTNTSYHTYIRVGVPLNSLCLSVSFSLLGSYLESRSLFSFTVSLDLRVKNIYQRWPAWELKNVICTEVVPEGFLFTPVPTRYVTTFLILDLWVLRSKLGGHHTGTGTVIGEPHSKN